jgi:hypothetical protein
LKEFGGLRAVGNSSPNPGPRFIHLTYTPKGGKNSSRIPHVVLIGKGITFDTGGISLKRPYDTMTAMKSDMAGAAAILATIGAVAKLGAKVKVSVLMMCAENALSGTSQRPSDVIKHYGGKTVEVINTDDEGRFVLADGLAFADINLDPDYVVDIATLTGAISLGLGRQYAAMYTRNKALAHTLSEIGERTGDRVYGALYFPNSSFDCFHGLVQGNELAMTIVDSYSQESYPYSIALANDTSVASADLSNPLTSFSLSGFYALDTLSENDNRMLDICSGALVPAP